MLETVIGFVRALATGFGMFKWWSDRGTRVRRAVREAEPDLYFHLQSYGGAGQGYQLDVRNRGQSPARDLRAVLPGLDGIAWQHERLNSGENVLQPIPLDQNAVARVERMPEAQARLFYRDRFGLDYERTVRLTQTRRDDGFLSLGSTGPVTVNKPAVGRREVWRLGRSV